MGARRRPVWPRRLPTPVACWQNRPRTCIGAGNPAARPPSPERRRAMSWNGHPVIDLDAHIVERADRFYGDYIDPAYREAYQRLCDAVARQTQGGGAYSLFGSRTSIIEPVE